jgi:hypothetical protein
MLRIDPKMIGRLDEIETDLHTRRARAETEGWIGELEGIDLTLTFLDGKTPRRQAAQPTCTDPARRRDHDGRRRVTGLQPDRETSAIGHRGVERDQRHGSTARAV